MAAAASAQRSRVRRATEDPCAFSRMNFILEVPVNLPSIWVRNVLLFRKDQDVLTRQAGVSRRQQEPFVLDFELGLRDRHLV